MKLSELIKEVGDIDIDLAALTKSDISEKPKKIDMSVLIKSKLDCEFRQHEGMEWAVGKLTKDIYDFGFLQRPRFNHTHASPVGFKEMPIPEGFIVKTWSYDIHKCWVSTTSNYLELDWSKVQMFEVTGIQEDFAL